MGQKVHPTSLRLYKTNRLGNSAWFSKLFYKQTFLKDWVLKKTATVLLRQSNYITPKIFTSFWNRNCDIYIFFLSKRKQYKKILFRFQSFLQKKIKEIKKTEPFYFPGKTSLEYKKFIKPTIHGKEEKIHLHTYTKKKNNLQKFLCLKIKYDKKYTKK
jgi:hypothetical protein